MIAFLCFQMLQHPAIKHSLNPAMEDLVLASIIISTVFKSVFHSIPSAIQKFWLKSQLKNRCCRYSLGSSSHRTHLFSSMWKLFLDSRSLVFSLSSRSNQKKFFFAFVSCWISKSTGMVLVQQVGCL